MEEQNKFFAIKCFGNIINEANLISKFYLIMEEQKKSNGALIGAIIVLILAIGAYGVFKYTRKEDTAVSVTPTVTPEITPPATPGSTDVTSSGSYKDGTYSATGNYFSPGGNESIAVQLTLNGDVITDVSATTQASRPDSVRYQSIFVANYKPLVVGKKIDDVVLSKVSGSSLTSRGFNDALTQIKAQAKA